MSKTSINFKTSKQAAMCCQWSSSHLQSHRLKLLCVARSHHPDTCFGDRMSDIIKNSRQFLLECWTGRPGGLQHLHSAFHYLAPGVREAFLFSRSTVYSHLLSRWLCHTLLSLQKLVLRRRRKPPFCLPSKLAPSQLVEPISAMGDTKLDSRQRDLEMLNLLHYVMTRSISMHAFSQQR